MNNHSAVIEFLHEDKRTDRHHEVRKAVLQRFVAKAVKISDKCILWAHELLGSYAKQ
jgi:hypothetical protein